MEALIRAVTIKDLFGLYSYDLPDKGKSLNDAAILYGDNGLGKSTILRLVFHLLSPAKRKGHRTALLKVPFRSLDVQLSSGVTFRAHRRAKKIDAQEIVLTIMRGSKVLVEWVHANPGQTAEDELLADAVEFSDDKARTEGIRVRKTADGKYVLVFGNESMRSRKTHPRGEAPYMEILEQHVPNVFLLNAERRLDGDAVSDPSDEIELRRALRMEEPKRINDLVVRSREIALAQALSAASRWVGSQAVQGANRGSTNVHGVYVNVLKHLVAPSKKNAETVAADPEALLARIAKIETTSVQLAKYELTPALSTSDFRRALQAPAKTKRELAANLIRPYIDSLEGRLEALEPIYKVVDDFVSIVNAFLNDKALSFGFGSGFRITNKLGDDLVAKQLSSGEQQLLLLFCYVLVSRDKPSVFIIDEPEISLNVKWQRKLVQSLLSITKGAQIQYIFASHSMELIAQHRAKVVKLESESAEG